MTGAIRAVVDLLARLVDIVIRYLQKREKEQKQNEAQERMDDACDSPGRAMSDKFGGMRSSDFRAGTDDAAETTRADDPDARMAGGTGDVDRGKNGSGD